MIILLALILFLSLSFYVFQASIAVNGAYETVSKVVDKERAFILLRSFIPRAQRLLIKYANGGEVSLNDPWAKPIVLPTPLGTVNVQVVDLDRYINLNSLKVPEIRETFANLLDNLKIDPLLLDRIEMWEGLKPVDNPDIFPYPPPRRPMASKYELLLIWNKTDDLYGKKVGPLELPGLLDLVTVHSSGKVNVNTAPYWILISLPGADPATVDQIIQLRGERKITNLQQLLGIVDMNLLYRWQRILTTKSRYFMVTATLNGTAAPTTLWFIYDIQQKKVVQEGVR